ncbi:hypothetical protein [Burkholderia cenocepacia]|uniref:hypothetical protein n=1 Tax=Burkholderia cenocepacia TaxID=95486 RepID=UPI00406CBA80
MLPCGKPTGVLCGLRRPGGTRTGGDDAERCALWHGLLRLMGAELVEFREALAAARERCCEPA